MPQAKGLKEISYFDCAGGGQVYVQGKYAYIAHMDAPAGTTILDVSDPKNPKQVAHIAIPDGVHTHKVRSRKRPHAGELGMPATLHPW